MITPKLVGAMCLVLSISALAANAKVPIADARKTALAKVPGTIVHETLKHKKQGHDHYNFRIKPKDPKAPALKKVEVDADSGQVIKVKDVKASDKADD